MGSAADAGRDDLSRQPYGSHRIESHRDEDRPAVSGRVWHHPDRASLPVNAAKRGKAQRVCKDKTARTRRRHLQRLPEARWAGWANQLPTAPAPIWGFSKRQLNVRHRPIERWGGPLVGRALISDPAGRLALAQRLWRQRTPNKSRLLFILISFVSVDPGKHDLKQRWPVKNNVSAWERQPA